MAGGADQPAEVVGPRAFAASKSAASGSSCSRSRRMPARRAAAVEARARARRACGEPLDLL